MKMKASIFQKNLFLENMLTKDKSSLNLSYIFKVSTIDKSFDLEKFKKVSVNVLQKFLNLRSYFELLGTENIQIQFAPSDIVKEAVSFLNSTDATLEVWEHNLRSSIFDLNLAPLWKLELFRNKNEYYIGFVFHHIIVDMISLEKIFSELSNAYFQKKVTIPSDKEQEQLFIKYLNNEQDYQLQQNTHLDYFKNHLLQKGLNTLLPYKKQNAKQSRRFYKKVSPIRQEDIRKGASKYNTTVFKFLMSNFIVTLFLYTRQQEITLGYPAGRRSQEFKELCCYTVNTLAIKMFISMNLKFAEIVEKVSELHENNIRNFFLDLQELKKVIRNNKLEKEASYFNIIFSSTSFGNLKDIPTELIKQYVTTAIHDIIFYIDIIKDKNWLFCLEVREDLLNSMFPEEFLEIFDYIVYQSINNINITLKDFHFSPKYRAILDNPSTGKFISILDLINIQKLSSGNFPAIITESTEISYTYLYSLIVKGASYLASKGVIKGDAVGLLLDKSVEALVAILSILKLGAIYTPIDITYPEKRKRYIIDTIKPKLLITNSAHNEFNHLKQIPWTIDILNNVENQKNDFPDIFEIDPAYIIFTSGSTGAPKGVLLSHRGLSNLAVSQGKILEIKPGISTFLFASLSFDASVSEWACALANGGSIMIANCDNKTLVSELPNLSKKMAFDIITLPPSILSCLDPEDLSSVKTILSAGESISTDIINKWADKKTLFNAYGPTEATVCATMHLTKHNDNPNNIGTPIEGVKINIVNADRTPLPKGAVGEIALGGKGVADRYINENEEKFFYIDEDKFYATGDLGYIAQNGVIFMGRVDRQVKIRGYRIELEEIQKTLEALPSIKGVYVCDLDKKEILAFIITRFKEETSSIKKKLEEILPDYMIPHHIIQIESFPLNTQGKIDKEILINQFSKENSHLSTVCADGVLNSGNELTSKITNIWEEILKYKILSLNDNFFEQGGDSLKAARLVLTLKKKLKIQITLDKFFDNPTINYLLANTEKNDCIPWEKDMEIIIPRPSSITTTKKTVFLTGATGFIGGYLLKTLFSKNIDTIYSLVRANSSEEGYKRIKDNLIKFDIDIPKNANIIPIIGDLSKPMLGISDKSLSFLKEVSDIFHAGAHVHHIYNYATLKKANVLCLKDVLEICTIGNRKNLHYISAISAINAQGIGSEEWPKKENCKLYGGYNQTKWVSEVILKRAYELEHPIYIYRLPTVWGSVTNHKFPWNIDHQALILKGCVQMGYIHNALNNLLIVPADYACESIINIAFAQKKEHIYNILPYKPYPFNKVLEILKNMGYSLNETTIQNWKDKLSKVTSANALYPLLPIYLNDNFVQPEINLNEGYRNNFHKALGAKITDLSKEYMTQSLKQILFNN